MASLITPKLEKDNLSSKGNSILLEVQNMLITLVEQTSKDLQNNCNRTDEAWLLSFRTRVL